MNTTKQFIHRIEINQSTLVGKPVIRGTRISVEQIMDMLVTGMTPLDIIHEFPHLTEADIQAAMFYATELVKDSRAYPRQFIASIQPVQ